jgi:DNA replication and repair protein RecF
VRHHADARVTLTRLDARNFRNLEELSWEPTPGSHLLLGDNGAGKTSLIEAIYVLATTRSFRAARLTECCRHDEQRLQLAGEVVRESRTRLELEAGADGTERRLNGSSASLSEHLAVLPVVSWTSADGEWVSGAPAARRRLLDRGVVGSRPGALAVLARYRRALEQKRRLLATGSSGLGPWNEVLAAAADELIRFRREHVQELGGELERLLAESDLELPAISLRYRPSPASGGSGVEETLEAFEKARTSEYDRGSPLVGPHRDELEISWGGHPARRVASAGERKLLGLAVTAARASLLTGAGRSPLLLLDDLDAELDGRRLAGIWAFFSGFRQLFITSNRVAVWEPFEVDRQWLLTCGKLTPKSPLK